MYYTTLFILGVIMYEIVFTNPRLQQSSVISFSAAGIPKLHQKEDFNILCNVARLLFGTKYHYTDNKYVYTGNYFEDRTPENGSLIIEPNCYLSFFSVDDVVKTSRKKDDGLEKV